MAKDAKLTPFSFINAINTTKDDLMINPEAEKAYVPFVINRSLSYFPDTVAIANEMNINHHIDSRLQYDFLLNIVRKRKRFSKWHKSSKLDDVEVIKRYYGYSHTVAQQALSLLTTDQLKILRSKVNTGGTK